MAEYIDKGTAIAKLTALEVTEPNATMTSAKRLLADMPAADVAPVVHCKDCKHYDLGVCLKIYQDGNLHSEAWQPRKPEDFCSYGERKGKNETERT